MIINSGEIKVTNCHPLRTGKAIIVMPKTTHKIKVNDWLLYMVTDYAKRLTMELMRCINHNHSINGKKKKDLTDKNTF